MTVSAPADVLYSIDLVYYINRSDSNRAVAIQRAVNAAVDAYITWQRTIGRDINPDELRARIKKAGARRPGLRMPAQRVFHDFALFYKSAARPCGKGAGAERGIWGC